MKFKSFDGTELFCKYHEGTLPCLVFIHGWASNWTTWEKEINYFQHLGHATLTFDLRGHGQSEWPQDGSKYELEAFTHDIYALLEHFKIDNFVLLGHSMGGMLTLLYQKLFAHKKQPQALILCDTTYKNILENKPAVTLTPYLKVLSEFICSHEHVQKEHFGHLKDIDWNTIGDESDYEQLLEGIKQTSMKAVFACLSEMMDYDVTDVLPQISLPVLIIEGEEDSLTPLIDAKQMYHKIRDAELDVIPHGKHSVPLENPKMVDHFIHHFLKIHSLL